MSKENVPTKLLNKSHYTRITWHVSITLFCHFIEANFCEPLCVPSSETSECNIKTNFRVNSYLKQNI